MNQKIGMARLSGLMIGPILGSGIILLPPIAAEKLGSGAIWAWLIIMTLGAFFAIIFARLSLLHPGEGGMTIAIEKGLGRRYKLFASLSMIAAVSFGPTAVLLTAAKYLISMPIFHRLTSHMMAILLVLVAFIVLLNDLKFISTISFVFSSIVASILILCCLISIWGQFDQAITISPIASMDLSSLGRVVFLLFWAIIGWEVIGNYSDQVKDINTTIPAATGISLVVVTSTYLLVSLALGALSKSDQPSITAILASVFGQWAPMILALLVTGLCLSTYLLIVGALARLLASLSEEGYMPKQLKKRNKKEVPILSVLYFAGMHILVLYLNARNLINLEFILAIANCFFLSNALIGLIASIFIIDDRVLRICGGVLSVCFLILLLFSGGIPLSALIIIFLLTRWMESRSTPSIISLQNRRSNE